MYYIYILKSLKDGRLYIGQTNDIENRLKRHNCGFVKATRYRTPLEVIYFERYPTRIEAMKREKYLKGLKGGNEFKKIILDQKGLVKRNMIKFS